MIPNKKDIEVLTNLMLEYSKENSFPFYEKILEFSPINKAIFSNLSKEEYYDYLIDDYISRKIDTNVNTKMGKLFKEKYKSNKVLFKNFVTCNINKDFSDEKFHKIGEEVKEQLNEIEQELFKSIENSQYKDFSTGLYKKYEKYIKSFFPYINNVGVKIISK